MSINVVNEYVNSYSANVQLLLQQRGTKLRQYVMSGSYVGQGARVVDQIGAVEALQVVGRFNAMPRVDALIDNRWVYPQDFHLPQMIDSFDKLRLIADPQSMYPSNATNGLGRRMDDAIIAAFFGTAKTGVDGSTSTTFGTTVTTSGGRNVAVATGAASATGMNVAKLRAGKKKLKSVEVDVDNDPIMCTLTSTQEDNLLADVQVTSADFGWKDAPVLKEGKVSRFLGVNFTDTCERLTTGTDDAASTSRQCPMWAKSGMHFGLWNDIQHNVSQRNDITGEPWQLYSKATFGATRIEENKVVRIWCYES